MRIWDILSSGQYTEIIIVGTIFGAMLIVEALLSLIIVSVRKIDRIYMLAYCILAGFIALFGTIFLILWIDVLRPLT